MKKKTKLLIIIFPILIGIAIGGFILFRTVDLVEQPFGCPMDSYNGVIVYYNGFSAHGQKRSLSANGYNFGHKFECVEFVKRYYYIHLHHKMPYTYGHACSFYKKGLKDGQLNVQRNLIQYSNPGKMKPRVDDLIVFPGNKFNPYGHVAIISKVANGYIEVVQQNTGFGTRSTFGLKKTGNWWKININALGWLRKEVRGKG